MALTIGQSFVESQYNSPIVDLCIELTSLRVTGSYYTPAAAGMLGGYVQGFAKGFGRCYIDGQLTHVGNEPVTIQGTWYHEKGPATSGRFKMSFDSESETLRGWWLETDTGDYVDWVWSQVDANTSIAAWVQSIGMARYVVACCEIYVLFTLTQFIAAWRRPDWSTFAQQWCNCIYSTTYLSFLLSYLYMQKPPSMAYILGVLAYFYGYVVFFVLYVFQDWEWFTRVNASAKCYLIGSILFLVGSFFLVAATAPSRDQRSTPKSRRLPFAPEWARRFSPCAKSASLFWGAICFLLGSAAFTFDAGRSFFSRDTLPWVSLFGYAVFLVGRFYFVWGSLTPDVGVFLQRTPIKSQITRMARRISRFSITAMAFAPTDPTNDNQQPLASTGILSQQTSKSSEADSRESLKEPLSTVELHQVP